MSERLCQNSVSGWGSLEVRWLLLFLEPNPVDDEILAEILPASRVQHHSGALGAASTHAGEAGFTTVGWPRGRFCLNYQQIVNDQF